MFEADRRFLFSRRYRITRKVGFSGLLSQKTIINQWFAVYVRPNDVGHARIGMVVAKRLVPSAVGRNRIKRKIRENFRILARAGNCRDVVVQLRRPFNESEYPRVFSALNEMLSGILAKE